MVSVSPGMVIPVSANSSPIVASSQPPNHPTSGPSSSSPPALRLVVDLSNFDLQQVSHDSSTLPVVSSCRHHMTLRPRHSKQAHLSVSQSTTTGFSASPDREPLSFKDASQNSAWQQAMQVRFRLCDQMVRGL